MRVTDAWALLGLEPTDETREVKRAYGRLLKEIDVDADPAAFIRLRSALDLALEWGAQIPEWELEDFQEEELEEWAGDEADAPSPEFDAYAGGFNHGPPARAPGGEPRLRAACDRLEQLLFAAEPPRPEEVESAGAELLCACGEAPVDDATAVEHWLLAAAAASIPRSDPLIEPAERHFGWGDAVRSHGYRVNLDLDDLLQRRAARALLDRCLQFVDPGHQDAAVELSRPGRNRLGLLEIGLAGKVRAFLDKIVAMHPMIEHDLDPDTLDWWRNYFERRHLPDRFWPIMAIAPVALTVIAAGTELVGRTLAAVGLAYAGSVVATFFAIILLTEVRARAAARERERGWSNYSAREAAPLIAGALLLAPVAAVVAGNFWTALACAVAGLAIGLGAVFETRAPWRGHHAHEAPLPPDIPAAAILASLAVGFAVPLRVADHIVVPMMALCYVAYRSHEAFAAAFDPPSRLRPRPILFSAGLLVLAAGVSLFAFVPALPPPVLLTLAPAALAVQHLATASAQIHIRGVEWLARAAAVFFHIVAGKALFRSAWDSALVALLLYVLGYSLVRIVLAYREAGREVTPPAYF